MTNMFVSQQERRTFWFQWNIKTSQLYVMWQQEVWHSGLLAKLNQSGIEGKILELFKSYLSNRQQIVVLDGSKSSSCNMSAGIPQGSKLGPILFIIYINDIVENLQSEILIFADDCTLLVSDVHPAQTTCILNNDLEKIKVWAKKWKITFNADKSRDIIFSNKLLNNSPPCNTNI